MQCTQFNLNGKLFLAILIVIFLCGQLSYSQKNPIPPALFQKFQTLQNRIPTNDNGNKNGNNFNNHWTTNFGANVANSKLFVDNAIPSFLKNVFNSTEAFQLFADTKLYEEVSTQCKDHSQEFWSQLLLNSLKNKTTETWALQMLDAWGKFPSGVLSGHVIIPGDFHECLQIRGDFINKISDKVENFKGKYCSTYIVPGDAFYGAQHASNKSNLDLDHSSPRDAVDPTQLFKNSFGANGLVVYLFPFVGTCFPSSCTKEDVQKIFTNLYKWAFNLMLEQYVVDCFTDEKPPFDAGDIAVISLLSLLVFLCLVGSVFDILVFRKRAIPNSGASFLSKCMLSFSVPLNTEKLLSTNAGSDNLGCLHGMRFLSMAWVVLAHTYVMTLSQMTWNLIDIQNSYRDWTLMTVLNGTPSVDTFFTMSGALMGYNLLRELERNKGRFNYLLMVIHRFLRITPTYIILVAMMATILPYMATGPQWYVMDMGSKVCEDYWWYNALYISNLVNQTNVCYGESWYLANDMQFFVVAPLIIYPLWRWRKIGFAILGAFSIASIVAPAVIQHEKELPPTNIPFFNPKTYAQDLYITPWARMGPYLVGIFLGYILYLKSTRPGSFRKLPLWLVVSGWILSTAMALLIIFGPFKYYDPGNESDTVEAIGSAFYAGLHRFGWGIVISWIIFACVSGYGGWVDKFLSWKVFMPLGRLTFCVYISSYHLQLFYHLTQTHPVHFSTYATVNMFFAHMVMACIVGYILTITLESPFIQLEKLLIQPKRSPPKVKTNELPNIANIGSKNDK